MSTTISMLLLKSSLLLALSLLVIASLRDRSAVSRHRVWSILFAALIALPVLALFSPRLRLPLPRWTQAQASPASNGRTPSTLVVSGPPAVSGVPVVSGPHAVPGLAAVSGLSAPLPLPALLVLWLAGVALSLAALLISLLRVALLRRSGAALTDADWQATAKSIAERLQFARPGRIGVSDSL